MSSPEAGGGVPRRPTARRGTGAALQPVPAWLLAETRKAPLPIAQALAHRLRRSIASRELSVGSPLPSERELMSRYQVSRTTVREALRMLSAQELIEVRRGRSGGSFISSPTPGAIVQSLAHFINGQEVSFLDLAVAREAIEPAAAAQAAVSRTADTLEALRLRSVECENSVLDIGKFVDANLRWHLALADASGNPLFVAFLTSVSTAMHAATSLDAFDMPVRKAVVGVHWQIYDAISRQDPDSARRRTARHLTAYSQTLRTISA